MDIPTYETYLKQGMTDPRVGQLQTALNQANTGIQGYTPLKVDEIFGPLTADALRKFQGAQNIQADAIYGPETAGAMQNYFNSLQTQQPATTSQTPLNIDVAQPPMTTQGAIQQTPQYQSPYEQQSLNLLKQMEQRYATGFQYDPTQDVGLQQAQQQAQSSVMEQMNRRGILASTITADRAAQEAQNLIPQYQQIAYGQWQDENQRLQEFTNLFMKLDEQSYGRFYDQWKMDWQQKDFDYQQKMDEFDIGRKRMSDAWDRVEQVGYVDNETSALLGLPVGTPSQRVRELLQEQEMQIAAEERELRNQIKLDALRRNNEIKILEEKQRIADEQATGENGETTPGMMANYNQILTGLSKMDPTEALRYVDRLGKEFYTDLIGGNLYNQLVNDLQTKATQPAQEIDTSYIENSVKSLIGNEQWEEALSVIVDSGIPEEEQIRLINEYEELMSLFEQEG